MKVKRIRPTQLQVMIHPYELAALVAAARWVVTGTPGEMPAEAVDQLKQVLQNYDAANRNS
jgi:hypothetical protein